MKFLVVLLSLAALSWAQDRPECQCGAFVSTINGEYEVHRLPPIDTDDCEHENKCAKPCADEWTTLTDYGNLDYVMDNGISVGQEACRAMAAHGHPNLGPHYVYAYYNLCRGPWMFDGETSQQKLCCVDGEYPGNCEGHPQNHKTWRICHHVTCKDRISCYEKAPLTATAVGCCLVVNASEGYNLQMESLRSPFYIWAGSTLKQVTLHIFFKQNGIQSKSINIPGERFVAKGEWYGVRVSTTEGEDNAIRSLSIPAINETIELKNHSSYAVEKVELDISGSGLLSYNCSGGTEPPTLILEDCMLTYSTPSTTTAPPTTNEDTWKVISWVLLPVSVILLLGHCWNFMKLMMKLITVKLQRTRQTEREHPPIPFPGQPPPAPPSLQVPREATQMEPQSAQQLLVFSTEGDSCSRRSDHLYEEVPTSDAPGNRSSSHEVINDIYEKDFCRVLTTRLPPLTSESRVIRTLSHESINSIYSSAQ